MELRGAEIFGILLLPVGASQSANRSVKLTSHKPAASLWVCAPQFTFTLAKYITQKVKASQIIRTQFLDQQ